MNPSSEREHVLSCEMDCWFDHWPDCGQVESFRAGFKAGEDYLLYRLEASEARAARAEEALREIDDLTPATQETSLAHMMADIARQALSEKDLAMDDVEGLIGELTEAAETAGARRLQTWPCTLLTRAASALTRLQGELAEAGMYTKAHEALDDLARERVAEARAERDAARRGLEQAADDMVSVAIDWQHGNDTKESMIARLRGKADRARDVAARSLLSDGTAR